MDFVSDAVDIRHKKRKRKKNLRVKRGKNMTLKMHDLRNIGCRPIWCDDENDVDFDSPPNFFDFEYFCDIDLNDIDTF